MTTHDETCGGVIAPLRGLPWREMKGRLLDIRWTCRAARGKRRERLERRIIEAIREWREAQK